MTDSRELSVEVNDNFCDSLVLVNLFYVFLTFGYFTDHVYVCGTCVICN